MYCIKNMKFNQKHNSLHAYGFRKREYSSCKYIDICKF